MVWWRCLACGKSHGYAPTYWGAEGRGGPPCMDCGGETAVDAAYPQKAATEDEEWRALALRLAVELRRGEDVTSGYVTRTAQAFEAYLRNGTVER